MWNAKLSTLILSLGLLIAGCGGGGGSAPSTSADTQNTPAPSTTTTPSSTPSSGTGSSGTTTTAVSQKNGPCAATYQPGFTLVEGEDRTASKSGFAKPAKGKPYNDPAYGSCVVRATNADGEGLTIFARNDYSRRQPFNADDSRFLAYTRGTETWHLYDTETLEYVRHIDLGGKLVEPQWHPTHPDVLYVFPEGGGMTIIEINVKTGNSNVITDFRDVQEINGHSGKSIKDIWPTAARVSTRSEGSPSADARYWGLMVMNSSGKGLGIITYDMLSDTITGVYDFATDGGGVSAPDHLSMSPSGDYVVPSWVSPECGSQLGTLNKPCGLMSFSRDFSSATGLAQRTSHSDTGVDANGNDVIVAANYHSGWVEMWDLATGQQSRLWQIYINGNSTAMHVSARSFNKPGWALISTYHEKSRNGDWFERKIMAVEMKANPRILNIAHTYSKHGGYFSEPHAAVNRDFTKIMFNSNWGTGNDDDVDAYMIELPKSAVPKL